MLTFRSLYTEGFFSAASSFFTPSVVFVRKPVTRHPLFSKRANVTMLQDSLNVTELTGDYSDQTFTGKLLTACRTHDFHLLECAHGAQTKRDIALEMPLSLIPVFIFRHRNPSC